MESEPITRSDEEWRRELDPGAYRVLRQGRTEQPYSGALWNQYAAGTYRCAACGNPVFASDAKFDSGTGWPSFWETAGPDRVTTSGHEKAWALREEVRCGQCGSHLGHVFDDGPPPTGLRYCINSAALNFEKRES